MANSSNTAPQVRTTNKDLHVHTIFNQIEKVANQDRTTRSDAMLNFYINRAFNKRVMHINSNKVPFQNQLAMSGITHKSLHTCSNPSKFINVGQTPLSYSNI